MDVDGVDFDGLYRRDRPGKRLLRDLRVQALTFECRHRLGIGEARNMAIGVEDDRSGDDRASQTPPSDLVTSRNAIEPPAPAGVLEGPHRSHANHREVPKPKAQ